jgi:hypothetical protein
VDETEAHIWRSQMLRLLSVPPVDSATDSLLSYKIREVSTGLAVEFLKGPIRLLLRQTQDNADHGKRDQELQRLYHGAGELSLSLWTQRTWMRRYHLSELADFRTDHSMVTAHRLHHLDEDDHRLNGKKILAVIQPAIVAFGNEDAEHYNNGKIWAKAVVIVDEST